MNDPFARLPEVPNFALTSTDVTDGEELPVEQMSAAFGVSGGLDLSPQLSWSGAPPETRSYTATMYDPDASSGSGLLALGRRRHPGFRNRAPAGAGGDTGEHLPAGAFQLPNDLRARYFLGAAPPAGDGRHRYVIVVQALDVEHVGQLSVQTDSTPALLGFSINAGGHLLGRAVIICWAEIPAA